ncbi:MAG: hypothetical protein M1830_004999 [Pleopsidium flavum]|nr:MAG: hypothetical protein M1830_004999 [Pleopsidium flavum]
MAILKKVEVRIKSGGGFLAEYNDPNESAPSDANTMSKFIEATSGAKFSIEVSINEGHRIDNKKARSPRDTRALKRSIHNVRAFDAEDGQWKTGSFTFARVEILENSEMPEDLDPLTLLQLGTITITIVRGVKKVCSAPQAREYTDRHIIPEPIARNYKHLAVAGSKGTPLVFKFHYRSHNALQIIGCIPRTPSPPIQIEEVHEPETKPAELARLDRLDRADGGVKVEAGQDENLDGLLRDPSVLSNVKRQRDNDGVHIKFEGYASRKRPRASEPIQTIDLTGD